MKSTSKKPAKEAADMPEPIEGGKLYRLARLKKDSGIGNAAIRNLRRDGMPILYLGSVAFVYGSDFIDAVRKTAKRVKHGGTGRRQMETSVRTSDA